MALARFLSQRVPRAEHAYELLSVWSFDEPVPVVVFLTRRAVVCRHQALSEQEWTIVLEDGEILSELKVDRIVSAVEELARRLGVSLIPLGKG